MAIDFTNLTDRQKALKALCDELCIEPGDMRTTAGEDTADYFPHSVDGNVEPAEQEIGQFCLVTEHDEFNYVYPIFLTVSDAENDVHCSMVDDDLYSEVPRMIVDLDTGKRLYSSFAVSWA